MGQKIRNGAIGGVAGGIVFGILMGMMGMLPMVGMLAGSSSPAVGFAVHMVISIIIGIGFALVLGGFATTTGKSIIAGLLYGMFWWFMGPLTLMPLMMGMGTQWSAEAMGKAMPSLMGHLIYGAILGFTFARLTRHPANEVSPRKV